MFYSVISVKKSGIYLQFLSCEGWISIHRSRISECLAIVNIFLIVVVPSLIFLLSFSISSLYCCCCCCCWSVFDCLFVYSCSFFVSLLSFLFLMLSSSSPPSSLPSSSLLILLLLLLFLIFLRAAYYRSIDTWFNLSPVAAMLYTVATLSPWWSGNKYIQQIISECNFLP